VALACLALSVLTPPDVLSADVSPPPSASFAAALQDVGVFPPDSDGAVGPAHLLVAVNVGVRIQDRLGTTLRRTSLAEFFGLAGTADVFDPQVVYDPYGGRWVVAAAVDRQSPSSALLIAVSRTANPLGAWSRFRIDADADDVRWLDQPRLGFNRRWIAVQGNLYRGGDDSGVFDRTQIFALDKAALYAGQLALQPFSSSTLGGSQVPAVTYDPDLDDLYFLQRSNDVTGAVRLYRLSGIVGAATLDAGAVVASGEPWASSATGGADLAPQLGTSRRIDAGDARMRSVVVRNGAVWGVHTVLLPAAGPTRSAVQWWQIGFDGTLRQRGRVDDPSGDAFFAFPSLAVNRFDDMLVGFSRFSAGTYASAAYAFRFGPDPPGVLRADTVFKSGEAPYVQAGRDGSNRWGDYSNAVVDPANDGDLWTIQEYAAADNRWGTWWGRVSPRCGNGTLDPGEGCDDGDLLSGDGCDENCTPTACGNGLVTAGEACDDGNLDASDGCASDCQRECAAASECDDGDPCTSDACSAGRCTNFQLPGARGASCEVRELIRVPPCGATDMPRPLRQLIARQVKRARLLVGRAARMPTRAVRLLARADRALAAITTHADALAGGGRLAPSCVQTLARLVTERQTLVQDLAP
jgi:cysteine-rich repeat protein